MFKSKKPATNPMLNKIAAQAPAVTSIASAGAAVGMAAYWLVSAANAIKASKPQAQQEEKKPAEKNQK